MAQAIRARMRVLHPGDVACAQRGEQLQTLVGSCVTVVMADPRRTVGVMCHIVHAHGEGWGGAAGHGQPATAWGTAALDAMYALLVQQGFAPQLCQAWVYGGGNMFPGRHAGPDVGAANARWTLQALADDGVRVLHAEVGGAVYRKVQWSVGLEPPQVRSVALDGACEVLQAKPWEAVGAVHKAVGRGP